MRTTPERKDRGKAHSLCEWGLQISGLFLSPPLLFQKTCNPIYHNADSDDLQYVTTKHKEFMEKSLVVSVRLPESLVEKLDELARKHRWYKRNAIMLKALEAFVYAADRHTQYQILSWWRRSGRNATLHFELEAEQ